MRLTVPELGCLQFSLNSQILRVLMVSGTNFKFNLSNLQNAFLWPKRRVVEYCAWAVSRDTTRGRDEATNEIWSATFLRQTAIFPDHPRRHSPLKFCTRSQVCVTVIYFKFHENRLS